MSTHVRKWISRNDVALVFTLPFYLLMSWVLPEYQWRRVCRRIAAVSRASSPRNPLVEKVADILTNMLLEADAGEIVQELDEGRREHFFQVFRDYRPFGWNPEYEISGLNHFEEARNTKKGVILWIDHFVFNGLLPKKFLAQSGYPFSHLSRPEHGFSKTEFGVRFLNPLRAYVEDRYLQRRVLIERGAEARSVRILSRLLKRGEIVSITAGAWEGRRIAKTKLLGCQYSLATGAPAIAHSTGSFLIPVAVFRLEDSSAFRIDLGTPILLHSAETKSDAINDAMEAYAEHLEPLIKAYPGQWRGWKYLE